MERERQAIVCQRCGKGFVMTPNYARFLARWGVKVIVPVYCMSCFFKAGSMPKQKGKVKWFSQRRGYGFIVDEEGQEIFFHQNQFLDENGAKPREGKAVQFHTRYASKGPEALNVELVALR